MNHKIADDGTFWMNLEDFVKYFEDFAICRLLTDKFGKIWEKRLFIGNWDSNNSGGGCSNETWVKNPQVW